MPAFSSASTDEVKRRDFIASSARGCFLVGSSQFEWEPLRIMSVNGPAVFVKNFTNFLYKIQTFQSGHTCVRFREKSNLWMALMLCMVIVIFSCKMTWPRYSIGGCAKKHFRSSKKMLLGRSSDGTLSRCSTCFWSNRGNTITSSKIYQTYLPTYSAEHNVQRRLECGGRIPQLKWHLLVQERSKMQSECRFILVWRCDRNLPVTRVIIQSSKHRNLAGQVYTVFYLREKVRVQSRQRVWLPTVNTGAKHLILPRE